MGYARAATFHGKSGDPELLDVALNHGVNTKARYGMPAAIQKYNARGSAIHDERFEFLDGARPERTLPLFAAFAANLHGATGQI